MSRRSQPPLDIAQQVGVVEPEEEEVVEGLGEGDEIMEDAQVAEGEYSMSVSNPSIVVHLSDAGFKLYAVCSGVQLTLDMCYRLLDPDVDFDVD